MLFGDHIIESELVFSNPRVCPMEKPRGTFEEVSSADFFTGLNDVL